MSLFPAEGAIKVFSVLHGAFLARVIRVEHARAGCSTRSILVASFRSDTCRPYSYLFTLFRDEL